jgi:hypothetical protein
MSDQEYMQSNVNPSPSARASVAVGTEDIKLTKGELLAGLQAGIGAGFAMGVMAIIVSLGYGYGPWMPFNDVAGALFLPLRLGSVYNTYSIIVGILIHFSISLVLGVLFAAMYAGYFKLTFDFGMPILVGVLYGMFTWLLARFLFLPFIESHVYNAPAFLLAHAVFGLAMGLLYPRMPARLK